METTTLDTAAALEVLSRRLTRQLEASMHACAHCGLCNDSCHYYVSLAEPQMVPTYKADRLRMGECGLCHVGDGGSLNPFGVDFNSQLMGGASAEQGLLNIEENDSDGDGAMNIDEMVALTHPGDRSPFPTGNEGCGEAAETPSLMEKEAPLLLVIPATEDCDKNNWPGLDSAGLHVSSRAILG